jgi:hypothetical protein
MAPETYRELAAANPAAYLAGDGRDSQLSSVGTQARVELEGRIVGEEVDEASPLTAGDRGVEGGDVPLDIRRPTVCRRPSGR